MLGLSRRALYRRLERLDLAGTIIAPRAHSAMLEAETWRDAARCHLDGARHRADGATACRRARRVSVLVVDDEAGVRHLMRRWLAVGGYAVAVAARRRSRRSSCCGAAPTAVALCDIRMPGHDGLWLADQLRRSIPRRRSSWPPASGRGAAVESLRQGVVDYLTKPFERDRLREAVSRGVEWHRSARDSRRWRERLEGEMRRAARRTSTTVDRAR